MGERMSGVYVDVTVTKDEASAAVRQLVEKLSLSRIQGVVGPDLRDLVADNFRSLPPNKNGWPGTGFYDAAARRTNWEPTQDGVKITADVPNAPGALKFRFNEGQPGTVTIRMKDKLLTIPASGKFYGRRATDIVGLRFVRFGLGGPMALVVGNEGSERVFGPTRFSGRKGGFKKLGVRSAGVVAFWLAESVDQAAQPEIVPTADEMIGTAKKALLRFIGNGGNN